MQIKKILILLNIALIQFNCGAIFWGSNDVKKLTSDAGGLSFLSNIEVRKKAISDLELYLSDAKSRIEILIKECTDTIMQIHLDASKIQNQGKGASDKQIEYLNRKLSILSTRKQNWINSQELGKETIEIIEKRIALQKEIFAYLQLAKPEHKPLYSWKEFQESQIKISEQIAQIESDKKKKERVKTQLIVEKETLLSLQKQVESKEKERDKNISRANQSKEDDKLKNKYSGLSETEIIKFESEIIDQDVKFLKERIRYSNQKIEKLAEEEKLRESELELLQLKVQDSKTYLTEIERRLILDFRDIEIAKTELNKEVIHVAQIKNEISKRLALKRQEKEKMLQEQNILQEQIKHLLSKNKAEASRVHLDKSTLQCFH
ncbi:MAG: hypothetical protein US49_C0001G0117 [candidate division TM6 bacterium GW2011_GWF2_37_49]|nr:MAG: hypothetical protein US49_C0001G0117 [candidate division TM6 bacterium GW2011_GWF2_37_49]